MNTKTILWTAGIAAAVFVAFAILANFGYDVRAMLPSRGASATGGTTPAGA